MKFWTRSAMTCSLAGCLALYLARNSRADEDLPPLPTAPGGQPRQLDPDTRRGNNPDGPDIRPGDDAPLDENIEPQARGPVHEAFLDQYSAAPAPGPLLDKQPPEPIDEIPPEVQPDAENPVWIGGYWQWDEDRGDYTWVSGCWRVAPPGQRWVPGYYHEAEGGKYQWVSGFWTGENAEQVSYLPQPPESLDQGPNGDPPSQDHFWIPGTWRHQADVGYRWQAGYWSPCHENWVWVPARYYWTPLGFVYEPGFWDRRIPYRGYLYAPVYWRRPVYVAAGFRYVPSIVINTDVLHLHLFVRPRMRHYYFGDYYGDVYATRGFYPWHSYVTVRRGYDPLFTYYRWHYRRQGIDFAVRMGGWHGYYARHAAYRPPHSFRQQNVYVNRYKTVVNVNHNVLVSTVRVSAARKDAVYKPRAVDAVHRRQIEQNHRQMRQLVVDRRQIERRSGATPGGGGRPIAGTGPGARGPGLKLPKPVIPSGSSGFVSGGGTGGPRPGTVRPTPGGTRPGTSGAGTVRPGTVKPGTVRPGTVNPGVGRPNPNPGRPGTAGPGGTPGRPGTRPYSPGTVVPKTPMPGNPGFTPRPGTNTPRPGGNAPRPGANTPRPGGNTPRKTPDRKPDRKMTQNVLPATPGNALPTRSGFVTGVARRPADGNSAAFRTSSPSRSIQVTPSGRTTSSFDPGRARDNLGVGRGTVNLGGRTLRTQPGRVVRPEGSLSKRGARPERRD